MMKARLMGGNSVDGAAEADQAHFGVVRESSETKLSGARVLVTGGAGFIGSNLVHALLEEGARVRVLDNFSTGNRGNLLEVENDVELVEGELRSYERVHAATRGIELVYHQGALPSVPRSVQDPLTTSAVNVEGTLNVLLAARDEGVRRVIYASSSSVYGDGGVLPRKEGQRPQPISPYAVSKLAAETYCVSFARVYGLETVTLRYFNVFGPGQDPHSQYAAVVPRFLRAVAAGEPVTVYGDGEQLRDFTYVGNIVQANLLAGSGPAASGEVLNIATGVSCSVNRLAELVGEALGREVERLQEPARVGDVAASWASIDRAAEVLGWRPEIDLVEGLRRMAGSLGLVTA
jgi:UDP-glucose 4-epimerase